MPQSLSTVLVHLVFSTKNRESFITPTVEAELHRYMATVFRDNNSPSLAINGTVDHIHGLFILSRTITIADIVEQVKTGSSRWLKTKGPEFRDFHWQRGYGAFSIGQSTVDEVKRYIRNQKQHHRKVSFQDEYRKFLHRYEIDFDERYVWD